MQHLCAPIVFLGMALKGVYCGRDEGAEHGITRLMQFWPLSPSKVTLMYCNSDNITIKMPSDLPGFLKA